MGERMTADGIDHGDYHLEDCIEAVIERFEDGYVFCPILWNGGNCQECYEVFETRIKRKGEDDE